jgi:hypothetical protein
MTTAKMSLTDFQQQNRSHRTGALANVKVLDVTAFRSTPEAPAIEHKEIELNVRYTSHRLGKKVHAWPVEVKKKSNKVVLKRDPQAKDSYTESRAHFDKYFVIDKE